MGPAVLHYFISSFDRGGVSLLARLLIFLTLMGLQNIFPSPYGEQVPLLALENIIGGIIMEDLTILNKQIELAFVQAFISYLYEKELITSTELSAIRLEVQKSYKYVDSNGN